ncbi:MAG TPA: GNAT family N-acetyltransferase [Anaerolineae bacterium]|nr:GNAT family N-acetyltransferase [Anaerolineae bacterium]
MSLSLRSSSLSHTGPRPINLNQDVPQILDLLRLVFQQAANSPPPHQTINSLSLRYSGRWFLHWQQAKTGIPPGIVWVENNRIIGNVSILIPQTQGRYLIANVAVHPDFRRRGIARNLMHHAIQLVKKHHGQSILLQVESTNAGAIDLYHQLNFETIGTIQSWEAERRQIRRLDVWDKSFSIRPLNRSYSQQAFALDQQFQDPDLDWPDPISPHLYRRGWRYWFYEVLNGRRREAWLVLDETKTILGVGTIITDVGWPHLLRLRFASTAPPSAKRTLLAKLLRRLDFIGRYRIHIEHITTDTITTQLIEEANFHPQRSLDTMRLTF